MKARTALLLVMGGLHSSAFAQAPAASDFAGTWSVRWLSNDSRNPLSVTQKGNAFGGSYKNDAGDVCPVSGSIQPQPRRVALQISCPKWRINMDGFAALDGKLIVGSYSAYGNSTGGFVMSRD